ncbi:DUF1217 domain-containing protein [Methylobacterium dankookense]|uniref:DUF1217 domain-containing protein n=1 Tax=Methylobacterium dankookense TaxID=560405 RepID=A0A564G731_9HYPH|nr:DUF1217 domain-containing protein [Methylobacterium dankookense]GJD56627.1 hypothetical protein IFDJLNFL_2524 [Methylobacterium dankookense]VUF15351.1 hypothetical protein MTDSW087_05089 [Methylobacterium dankookense]
MTSTLTSYALIARDLPTAIKRKAAEATVARETAYYEANIGKVTSVDDLLADRRLYAYAMKAYGLEDMTYATAFMRKVLTEGTADSTSFANRLADDRYVAFAKAFDFSKAFGTSAMGTDDLSSLGVTLPASAAQATGSLALTGPYDFSGTNEIGLALTTKLDAKTSDKGTIVLNRQSLLGYAANLSAVTPSELVAAINGRIAASGEAGLKGKVEASLDTSRHLVFSTTSYTDFGADGVAGGDGADADTSYAATGSQRTVLVESIALSDASRTALDLGFGTGTAQDARMKGVVDAYLRQSLEEDAGAEDTGVRLALYFARKASSVTSAYDILGDSALSQVANTLAGLPATSGAATSDALTRRAEVIASKIDIPSLKDPAKVEALAKRFAAIWDAQNNTQAAPVLALFTGSGSGITADMLAGLQSLRFGG